MILSVKRDVYLFLMTTCKIRFDADFTKEVFYLYHMVTNFCSIKTIDSMMKQNFRKNLLLDLINAPLGSIAHVAKHDSHQISYP